jgi:hypothetical protein
MEVISLPINGVSLLVFERLFVQHFAVGDTPLLSGQSLL